MERPARLPIREALLQREIESSPAYGYVLCKHPTFFLPFLGVFIAHSTGCFLFRYVDMTDTHDVWSRMRYQVYYVGNQMVDMTDDPVFLPGWWDILAAGASTRPSFIAREGAVAFAWSPLITLL